ncbi:hypothetical protein [Bradyrhizobium sp.]|nr:hypothetical protein [Bradyrhizobium sp.]MBV8699364.1 hypothetical protein [Bradyrhizobium sp.]MBV9982335.1 hypothetical protein [Bradyrhizobium sp.]
MPKPFTKAMIARAMPIAMMPHSIAVATTTKKHESLAFIGLCLVVKLAG